MDKTIDLIEAIGGWNIDMQSFYTTLRDGSEEDTITIPVNSYGGEVFDGTTMYNIIKDSPSNTHAKILGYAMSAGTLIACGADKVSMPENGYYMIHNPWTFTAGESKDLRKDADLMDKMTDQLVAVYVAKSNVSEEKIRAMMDETTFLTGQEALEMGFVDELYNKIDIQASFSPGQYANAPKELIVAEDPKKVEKPKSTIASMFSAAKEFFESDEAPILMQVQAERDDFKSKFEALQETHIELQAQADKAVALSTEVTSLKSTIVAKDAEIIELSNRPTPPPTGGKEGEYGDVDMSMVCSVTKQVLDRRAART